MTEGCFSARIFFYYGERNSDDIDGRDDNEALAYRDCKNALSEAVAKTT